MDDSESRTPDNTNEQPDKPIGPDETSSPRSESRDAASWEKEFGDNLPYPGEVWELIGRLLAGELTEREEVDVRQQIDRDPAWRAAYDDAYTIWHRGPAKFSWNPSAALARV